MLAEYFKKIPLSTRLIFLVVAVQAVMLFLMLGNKSRLSLENNISTPIIFEILAAIFVTACIAYFLMGGLRKLEKGAIAFSNEQSMDKAGVRKSVV